MDSNAESLARTVERRTAAEFYTRYFRLVKVARLLHAAFWTVVAFFLFWAIPWLPGGLSEEDYNSKVALTLILASAAFGIGAALLVLREWLRRQQETLTAINAVYDGSTGLYNRRYFYDRLALECERALRQGTTFSVLLFRFDLDNGHDNGGLPGAVLSKVADEVVRRTRDSDLAAVLGGNDLAVAAIGVDKAGAGELGRRLRLAIEQTLARHLNEGAQWSIRLGISQFSRDGNNAATLLRLARESMDGEGPDTGRLKATGDSEQEEAA